MINIEDVTVLNDVRERLQAITQEQVDAALRRLNTKHKQDKDRKGESLIGVIESQVTRCLYTLWLMLEADARVRSALSQSATDENVEKDNREQSVILSMFAEVVKEVFWAQAKNDLGFHEDASVGIREDWTLVRRPEQNSAQGFIRAMQIPLGPEE